ncbi:MAG: permease prefix domain 1-containing protein [Oscillospiraceae bacterium]|jgi:hypothetical protein|nr:permease prefix domain 1-containing protein [Oscillospiraceae bacterium]
MESKIHEYIETLFADSKSTRRSLELKDEVTQNLLDRYRDLVERGKSEEDAFNAAIISIGDIGLLIKESEQEVYQMDEKGKIRSAVLTAAAVMMYILSVVPVIITSYVGGELAGVVIMFMLIAAATGLLIFNNMTKPKYFRAEDTVVEDFREWQYKTGDRRAVLKSIDAAIWSVTLALYFIISFATMAWYVTWVIFIIAVAVTQIIKAFFDLRQ